MLTCYTEIANAKELQNQLPNKPYCSDNLKYGMRVRPREFALTQRYIQLNPPHMKVFLTFDLDYDAGINYLTGGVCAVEDEGLPQPMWYVVNKKNGHSHLIYVLNNPVFTTNNARPWPLRYLAAIETAMRRKLGGDPMYTGLISKNPWSDFWLVYQTSNMAYDLEFLADRLNLTQKALKQPVEDKSGLGRNCCVFEHVRVWAYREIRKYWVKSHACRGHDFTKWLNAVLYRCQEENANFGVPLDRRELRGIAQSIAKWTWRHTTPEGFSEYQTELNNMKSRSQRQLDYGRLREFHVPHEAGSIKFEYELYGIVYTFRTPRLFLYKRKYHIR